MIFNHAARNGPPAFALLRRDRQVRGYSLRLSAWVACSPRSAFRAEVAQLVEQLIRNQQVTGSSPVFGSLNLAG